MSDIEEGLGVTILCLGCIVTGIIYVIIGLICGVNYPPCCIVVTLMIIVVVGYVIVDIIRENKIVYYYNKGVSLGKLGKYEEAIRCYDKAISINPDYLEAWVMKGRALEELKKYEEAIKCYDKAISINPDYWKAWYNKGVSLGKLGRLEDAIRCYDKAISINPDLDAWYNKGVSLGKLGRYEDAIRCYDKAISINPDYSDAWFNKGWVLDELKKYEEAIKCYDKVLELNPNEEGARRLKRITERKLRDILLKEEAKRRKKERDRKEIEDLIFKTRNIIENAISNTKDSMLLSALKILRAELVKFSQEFESVEISFKNAMARISDLKNQAEVLSIPPSKEEIPEKSKPNYYDILGIKQDATPKQIKDIYRKLSLIYHPDSGKYLGVNGGQRFKEIKEAYETLIDIDKRKEYDKTIRVWFK